MTAEYGWYGDDFTGATDTLASIAQRGRRAFLFLGVPGAAHLAAVPDLEAIGIAGAARTMPPDAMRAELAPVAAFFRQAGARLLHYKCCSTFDSGAGMGNLAVALDALRGFSGDPRAVIVGGQPSLGRYCAFGNLFATAEGQVHRLDRHPTMAHHPATPMAEADLTRHFAAMGARVGLVPWTEIDRIADHWDRANGPLLVDVLTPNHLDRIGAFLRGRRLLAIGASSVAEAFFAAAPQATRTEGIAGPVLALAGSLSAKTRAQVAAAQLYTHIPLDAPDVAGRAADILRGGGNVLLNSAAIAAAPGIAAHCAALVDRILRAAPVGRLAVAGGDTSSRVVMGLGIWGLAFHSRMADGVAVCTTRSDDPTRDRMTVLLKGGQMGDDRLFDRFAARAA
ncbi:four-carbon acid sugar kinase family protein [Falsirhodobacter xinxiangensis]|uniref:four-carbon acid sugar kinase family protein n=1 Tax=Falsirhodobacter xinxiangensis TaxID=2530049 RepID=UPI0010A9D7D0|nr:four-carbon acid sugar kinase family protein [Rhodobacter xinxiangensis]